MIKDGQSIIMDANLNLSSRNSHRASSKVRQETSSAGISVFILSTIGVFLLAISSFYIGNYQTIAKELEISFSETFSSFYSVMMNFYVISCIALIMSPYGKIRLGVDKNDKPKFSTLSWLTMLFSAGMGIGLYFYGVAEPLTHHHYTFNQENSSISKPLSLTMLHWGVHAWSCYAIIGLCFAYFAFRKNLSFSIIACLSSVFGNKKDSFLSKVIETTTILCPIVGIATSLGLGAMQITDGLAFSFGLKSNIFVEIGIIAMISTISTFSVVSGVEKGMKFLSIFNMFLSFVLLFCILTFISPVKVLSGALQDVGTYFLSLPSLSVWSASHNYLDDGSPINWTTYHWAGWIAWAPFVGMFIAQISRGRTIREFLLGVILVPTLLSGFWFSTLGRSGIEAFAGQADIAKFMIKNDLSQTFFMYLSKFSGSLILYAMAIVSLKLFFVTSSDSAALVIATSASGGKAPSKKSKIYWSMIISILAIVFLLSGGIGTMQLINIASAAPFAVLSLIMIFCLGYNLILEPQNALKKR